LFSSELYFVQRGRLSSLFACSVAYFFSEKGRTFTVNVIFRSFITGFFVHARKSLGDHGGKDYFDNWRQQWHRKGNDEGVGEEGRKNHHGLQKSRVGKSSKRFVLETFSYSLIFTQISMQICFSDEIVKETGNENLTVMKIDLSSFQSIRDFAKEFLSKVQRLDVLIHNAGYGGAFAKHKSADDIEITFAINHYGPFLLTHLLIDILKKSAPSRIVVVASDLYKLAKVNLENLNPVSTWPTYLYYSSKGANIMFCTELARRLEGTNVTANCLHPGMLINIFLVQLFIFSFRH
jgi:NAD(P)-dependent dehydrogenase (short-subunit alcohol dehydrogenase family)